MIEASNLLKEFVDRKSDLGKLSQMDSSSLRENGANIYDELLAKPDGMDSLDIPSDKPWYEDDKEIPSDNDDDLLNSQKEHEISSESEIAIPLPAV